MRLSRRAIGQGLFAVVLAALAFGPAFAMHTDRLSAEQAAVSAGILDTEQAELGRLGILLENGQYGDAATLTNRLRRRDPDSFAALTAAASAQAEANATDTSALEAYALLQWAAAQDDLALALYEAILQVDPTNVFAYLFRGSSGLFTGDSFQALADFQQAVNLDADNAHVYAVIGSTHQQVGNIPDALIALDQAIRIDPGDARSHYYRGMALLDNGDPQSAKVEFETVLNSTPTFADAWYDLARVDYQLDSPAEAMRDLDEAIEMDPAFDLALAFRGALKEWSGERESAAADYLSYMRTIHPQYVEQGELAEGTPASVFVAPSFVYEFSFEGRSGETVTLTAEPQANAIDPVIVLLGKDGVTPLSGSDRPTPEQRTAGIDRHVLPQDGTYWVLVALSDTVQSGPVTVTLQ